MNTIQADAPHTEVSVRAPARLHLGFLDLNASIGRKFGSIGIAVNSHFTHIKLCRAEKTQLVGHCSDETRQKVFTLLDRFYETFGQHLSESQRTVLIELKEVIPEHAGLGSGTQLAMVLGTALCRLHKINISASELAHHLDRGKRSGIGVATFSYGGFIVDGGLAPSQSVPPMLMQHTFPQDWYIVMIMDPDHMGVHGQKEKQAFKNLPVFPLHSAQAICHITLMQLLPSLVEQQIDAFGDAITKIQALIGDHFAPIQGGRYASNAVSSCLMYAQSLGHKGIAQSSWGPTGCIFVNSEQTATELISQVEKFHQTQTNSAKPLTFMMVQANNQGAIIETTTKVPL